MRAGAIGGLHAAGARCLGALLLSWHGPLALASLIVDDPQPREEAQPPGPQASAILVPLLPRAAIDAGVGAGAAAMDGDARQPIAEEVLSDFYRDLMRVTGDLSIESVDFRDAADLEVFYRRMGIAPEPEPAPLVRKTASSRWALALVLAAALGVYVLQYRRRRRFARAARSRRHIAIADRKGGRSGRRRSGAATRSQHAASPEPRQRAAARVASGDGSSAGRRSRRRGKRRSRPGGGGHSSSRRS